MENRPIKVLPAPPVLYFTAALAFELWHVEDSELLKDENRERSFDEVDDGDAAVADLGIPIVFSIGSQP